ncbi:Peptidase family M50 [uncultured archaeon]|nr:Peptidase family M50 [uncultured archaeon]
MSIINWMRRKFGSFWNVICDMGLVMGFGLSSKWAFKHIKLKFLLLSMAALLVFTFVIYPYLMVITMTIMDLPTVDSGSGNGMAFLSLAALLAFGFVGMVLVGLFVKAASILASVAMFVLGDPAALAASSPGVSFIIPGLTIPLLEGIIALFVLLVVHEGSHGIAAILAKIKIRSTGFLLFGFIPVGAFVDIDEKQLGRSKQVNKLRVAVAGSAANLTACAIFFVPTMIILLSLPAFFDNQLLVTGFTRNLAAEGVNITAGTVITGINGIAVSSLADYNTIKATLQPDTEVHLVTDKGPISFSTDSSGKMGLLLTQPIKAEFWWVKFVYVTLGLISVLNFFIAVINLVPMQAFDGYRILQDSVKDQRVVRVIAYSVLAALLINILPWVWR